MSDFFDEMNLGEALKKSMDEIIDYEKGKKKLRTFTHIKIPELTRFEGKEIKEIRESINYSQAMFAKLLGVSKSTVEYWEAGKSMPAGSSQRILALIKNKKENFIKEIELIGV